MGATQHQTRHKFARAVVVGGVFVVVAGHRVQTTFSLVLVAHPVAVHVEQQHCAVRRAFLTGVIRKDTRPVVLRGRRIVVARGVAGAALARIVIARRTVGGRWVVVACSRILATHHFIRIAHAIAVLVTQNHHACAVQFSRTRLTWTVCKHTIVRIGGLGVEVAGRGNLTPDHFQLIAHPVAIGVVDARAVALVQRRGVGALEPCRRWVSRVGVVVARQFVLTAGDFQFVAHPVAIGVVHAVAIAVVRSLGVHASAVVEVDFRIEVARTGVVATKRQT